MSYTVTDSLCNCGQVIKSSIAQFIHLKIKNTTYLLWKRILRSLEMKSDSAKYLEDTI